MIDEETPDVYITLVHGTWGRGFFPDRRFYKGAKRKQFWFDDGSLFTTRLKSKLKKLGISYKIQAHEWSGANSILERAKVAKQLAAQLQASRAEYPAAKQVVIAHSHGGNVVRLALKEIPDRRHILVVTMATPFAEINVMGVSNTEKRIILGIWGAW